MPGPSGWSPRRRSYLSFHACAAWSFPSGQASSRYGLPVFSSSASPCRSLQPLRPGQPAARVGPFQLSSPAPASTRKKVVATASRREGACNRAGEPSEPFFGEEPRRNEQGPGNLLPGPSGWSPRRRSYLSFHDCAAWSRRVGPLALPSAPCLQQLRLAPPAAGGARLRCVASTLCWLTGMENTSFPKPQKESTLRVLSFCGSGSYLSFHAVASTVFSAYKGLTSVFGMGTGGSP